MPYRKWFHRFCLVVTGLFFFAGCGRAEPALPTLTGVTCPAGHSYPRQPNAGPTAADCHLAASNRYDRPAHTHTLATGDRARPE